ncbi:hypothetical protein PRVXT_001944 [Proteinivorax tanatarense]|uniref:DUF5673 domain-containing protein n=1 Tax=Proteinivorax tanatarense TaxID=1260629 RepID=A0AAU7VIQ0_9FIRM
MFLSAETVVSLLFLLFSFCFLLKICFKKIKINKYAQNPEWKISDSPIVLFITIFFGIIAVRGVFIGIIGAEYVYEWAMISVFCVLFLYFLQSKKIYTNGLSTRSDFYSWKDIDYIIVGTISDFKIYLKKRDTIGRQKVSISVKPEDHEKLITKLKEKGITVTHKKNSA